MGSIYRHLLTKQWLMLSSQVCSHKAIYHNKHMIVSYIKLVRPLLSHHSISASYASCLLQNSGLSCTYYGPVEQKRRFTADPKTTALTIWKDLKHLKSSPVPALTLGMSGLIPFASVPLYMLYTHAYIEHFAYAQLAYGACILSFIGGVRWGFVISESEGNNLKADWFNLGYSVLPTLVAWGGLLLPQSLSILTVMVGIAGAAYFDTTVKEYPAWFKALRFVLSLGAVLSLWTVFLCKFILNVPPEDAAHI